MKKLRFLGIVVAVMMMFTGSIVDKVYAYDCTRTYSWSRPQNGLGNVIQNFEKPIYLNKGECFIEDTLVGCDRSGCVYGSRTVACKENGLDESGCGNGMVCSGDGKCANSAPVGKKDKKCKTIMKDGKEVEVAYIEPVVSSYVNLDLNGMICKNNSDYGLCDYDTGVVSVVGNCGDKVCRTVYNEFAWSSNQGWWFECVSPGCSITDNGKTFTAMEGEKECIRYQGQWFSSTCISGEFTRESSDFCQNGCVESIENQPKCLASDDVMCTKINSQTIDKQGSSGDKVCSGSSIYECQKDKAPEYQFLKDCSTEKTGEGKSKVCGVVDSKVGCYSEEQVQESGENQSFVQIDMVSDSGFFCDGNNGIQTALGCIPYSMSGLAGKLLPLLFGIAGGISFLLMVFGFIMVATSSGDEKKLVEARSRITSAITGLLVSIFAIFLFRLIFSNILKIPGL